MESAVSFVPLRPADFVNLAGRGGAGPAFHGAGRGSLFFRGAGRGGVGNIPGSYGATGTANFTGRPHNWGGHLTWGPLDLGDKLIRGHRSNVNALNSSQHKVVG